MSCKLIGVFGSLVGLLLGIQGKDLTLQFVTGSVTSDNFTYYTLSYEGPISLILDSLDGDADLYISQYLSHPSYVLSEYCLHSASCGQDRIDIPSTFKRPIGVAVYGHILYPNSTYRLKVIVRDELEQVQEIGEDMILDSNVADPRKIAIPGVGNIEDSESDDQVESETSEMLDFENQMFLDILNEDGLMVAARGIGLDNVFLNLLKVYSDPGNLVIVLGTSSKEEEFFIKQLESMNVNPLPKLLTSEFSVNDRQSVYMDGGVIFSSSRILVVDMLMERMPIELVTGILVFKAHKVIETSQEAFILRLYRQKNKKGFIKAFSSSPISFTRGFCQISRVMRSLFVRHLFLWPRFHATIQATLKDHQPDVIELRLPLTQTMVTIQTAVLDLIQFTVKELKRINPSLDLDEMTVENAMSKCYKDIVKYQLEPVWHQLSGKTKQLISDLGTLRTLLVSLTQYDCVTYNVVVKSLQTAERAIKSSGWMLLDSAEHLFVTSKARVLGKSLELTEDPVLEENPKWTALLEVMKEIKLEQDSQKETVAPGRILIVAEDDRTCIQLKQVLNVGPKEYLRKLLKKSCGFKDDAGKHNQQTKSSTSPEIPEVVEDNPENPVIIQSLRGNADSFKLHGFLYDDKPRFIVMYDCDISFVRQVEVYQATCCEQAVRVYFLFYDGSAEEQAYLTNLRREKEAFEMLIREKATMVIPEDREGRTDDHPDLVRDSRKASDMAIVSKDTRDMARKDNRRLIVVDMREFRCELPSLIHRRGIDILPVTIEVGDYILTPDICVERKSLSDLIGSLNNGRLYNQAQEMCRHYAKPLLLIEFDHDKPFALQGKYFLSTDDSSLTDVTAKLQLLTMHFPKLRIVWSPGPYATAEIFDELKKGRDQPDPVKAAAITSDSYTEKNAERYNPAVHDFVYKLPGINSKNIRRVLNRIKDLKDLVLLSQEELHSLLENATNAKDLWEALHGDYHEALKKQQPEPTRGKGKRWKSRARK